jgi:hypothetical protein
MRKQALKYWFWQAVLSGFVVASSPALAKPLVRHVAPQKYHQPTPNSRSAFAFAPGYRWSDHNHWRLLRHYTGYHFDWPEIEATRLMVRMP